MLADCFCKLAIPKVYLSLLFSPVKKRNVLCAGEHKYNDITRSCYFHILKIGCIRPFISKDAWKMLVNALVSSRLEYGNALLYAIYKIIWYNQTFAR